jgi:hypothetical protein
VRGGRDKQNFVAQKGFRTHVSGSRRSFNESERNFLFPYGAHNMFGIAAEQRRVNAGVFRAKLAEQARQNVLRNRCGSPESEAAGMISGESSNFMLRPRHELMHAPCVLEQHRSRRRQSGMRPGAIEELNAEIFFKSLDLQAYRGLRQVKLLGSFAKALLFRNSPEDNQAEVLEIRHGSIRTLANQIWSCSFRASLTGIVTETENRGVLQIMPGRDQETGLADANLNLQKMKGAKNMPEKLAAARRR